MAEDDARELTRAVNNLTRVVTNLDELLRRDYPKRAEIERRFTSKQQSRRMFAQGLVLIVIIAALGIYFQVQTVRQRECFEQQLSELSRNYDARAALNERETALNKKLWLIQAEAAALASDDSPTLTPEEAKEFQGKLIDALVDYQKQIGDIEDARDKLPPETYQPGSCD